MAETNVCSPVSQIELDAYNEAVKQRTITAQERLLVSSKLMQWPAKLTKITARDTKSIALSTVGMIGAAALSAYLQNLESSIACGIGTEIA